MEPIAAPVARMLFKRISKYGDLYKTWAMVEQQFADMGYLKPCGVAHSYYPDMDLKNFQTLWPYTSVFVAQYGYDGLCKEIIGTVSCTQDSKRGIPAEKTFPDIVDKYRNNGRIGSAWRVAVTKEWRHKKIYPFIIDKVFWWVKAWNIKWCFAEIHPDYVKFYEKRVGFKQISDPRPNKYVEGNSDVLMVLDYKNLGVWSDTRNKLAVNNDFAAPVGPLF